MKQIVLDYLAECGDDLYTPYRAKHIARIYRNNEVILIEVFGNAILISLQGYGGGQALIATTIAELREAVRIIVLNQEVKGRLNAGLGDYVSLLD